jgi:hypothetical protein
LRQRNLRSKLQVDHHGDAAIDLKERSYLLRRKYNSKVRLIFLAELGDPEVFLNIEKVIMHTKWSRDRLKFVLKRVEMMREKAAEKNRANMNVRAPSSVGSMKWWFSK